MLYSIFILDVSFDVGPIRHFQYGTGTANKRLAEQVGVQQSISHQLWLLKKFPSILLMCSGTVSGLLK
jgi:hypothetical protein